MADEVHGLLVGHLSRCRQRAVGSFRRQAGAVAQGKDVLLAPRDQVGFDDDLTCAIQFQPALPEAAGGANTSRPDFEGSRHALTSFEQITSGVSSQNLHAGAYM